MCSAKSISQGMFAALFGSARASTTSLMGMRGYGTLSKSSVFIAVGRQF